MLVLELRRPRRSRVATVTARGTLDGRSADNLDAMLEMAAAAERVVIDIGEVRVVDAAGLAALIGGIGRLREAGRKVEMATPPLLPRSRWSGPLASW